MPQTAPAERTIFEGFSPATFAFFEALSADNSRDWFDAHREDYERHCRGPMAAFVEAADFAFAAHDIPLSGSAKTSLFRIHRDTRFSKDKRPYKTNIAALMTRDGTKAGKGVFYISLAGHGEGVSREGMFGAGFYRPEPDDLGRLRRAVADDPDRWLELEADLTAAGLTLSREDALKRLPKGFEDHANSPAADALKLRGYHVWRALAPDALYRADLVDEAVAFSQAVLPLLRFGWSALARD